MTEELKMQSVILVVHREECSKQIQAWDFSEERENVVTLLCPLNVLAMTHIINK